MSARFSARPLLSHGLRGQLAGPTARAGRSFSATATRRSGSQANAGGSANAAQTGWSGRSVLAVALATGTVGWGLASSVKDSSAGAAFLPLGGGLLSPDSQSRPINYATMAEMEQVGCFLRL
ncbi:D-lactate dehydrogenase mitochondrial precursor [Colletotrichum tofieldiae]|nr:D-lactate dehydrogenase mitochondrial precursor [Colletotrichum tofieldiae]